MGAKVIRKAKTMLWTVFFSRPRSSGITTVDIRAYSAEDAKIALLSLPWYEDCTVHSATRKICKL